MFEFWDINSKMGDGSYLLWLDKIGLKYFLWLILVDFATRVLVLDKNLIIFYVVICYLSRFALKIRGSIVWQE